MRWRCAPRYSGAALDEATEVTVTLRPVDRVACDVDRCNQEDGPICTAGLRTRVGITVSSSDGIVRSTHTAAAWLRDEGAAVVEVARPLEDARITKTMGIADGVLEAFEHLSLVLTPSSTELTFLVRAMREVDGLLGYEAVCWLEQAPSDPSPDPNPSRQ